jgi:hypothetical protein
MAKTIESKGPKCNRQFQLLVYLIKIFQHNQLYDTLLPAAPCTHKLKDGIAFRLDNMLVILLLNYASICTH